MKLIIALEFESTGALEMSWFHALSAGKGTKPFRLAPTPVDMMLQALFWPPVPPVPPEPPLPPEPFPPEPPD
jgi:hypothetical protein